MIDLTKGTITFSEGFENINPADISHELRITLYEELFAKAMLMRAAARNPGRPPDATARKLRRRGMDLQRFFPLRTVTKYRTAAVPSHTSPVS